MKTQNDKSIRIKASTLEIMKRVRTRYSVTNDQLVLMGLALAEQHFQKLQAHINRQVACDED